MDAFTAHRITVMRSTWDAMKYLKHGAMYWPTKQPDHWSNGVLILSDRRFAAPPWARERPSGFRARYKSFSDAARLRSEPRGLRLHRVTNMHPSRRHSWDVPKWGISLCGLQQKSGGPHCSKLLCPPLTFLIRSPWGCNECPQRSLISWISGWIVRCTIWHYFSKIPTIRSDSTFPISKIYSISADRQPKLCSKPSQTPLHNAAAY